VAAAGAGDGAALALLDEVARWFGRGLAGLIAALDPEAIVVGGGLGSAGEPFLGPARDEVRAGLYGGQHRPATPILPAAFGSEGGLVGAALAAWREVSLRFRFREAGRRVIGTRARGLPPGRERRSGR